MYTKPKKPTKLRKRERKKVFSCKFEIFPRSINRKGFIPIDFPMQTATAEEIPRE